MRNAKIERKTAETEISLFLELDGRGTGEIQTGCGFLNHMLTLFAKHGRFDLTIACTGDTEVDDHHTVEDVGICLGKAFAQALGEMRGIRRYGNFALPMDEALVLAAVDFSGRGTLGYALDLPTEKIGAFDTQLVKEFWLAFVREAGATLHLHKMAGENSHHIAEAAFKGAGRAMAQAVSIDPDFAGEIPSTKGMLV